MSLARDPGLGHGFLAGGGEVGAMMRRHDWSASPLGAPGTWPQSLRSVIGLLLNSKFPMFVTWGPELGLLYNDPYAEILGAKHPWALGRRFRDVWAEIWPDISPFIDAAMTGAATYRENLPLLMNRRGFDEETWFTFSYSPVRDENGAVAGVFCACTETTAQVLAERQQRFRIDLDATLAGLTEPRSVMDAAVEALGRHLGASRVGYSEVLPDDATIVCASCYADGVEPLFGTFRLDDFGPDSILRQRAGRTEVCDDVMADPGQVHATWTAIDTRAFVSVPLIRDGRFTASLYVNQRQPRRWAPHEAALIEDVAARTWDAVQRARAQADLRESEARFRNMADHTPVMMWVTDPSGRCTYLNRAWYEFTGQTEAEAEGFGWLQATHPDDGPAAGRAFLEANAAQRPFRIEYRLRHADGGYRWAIDAAAPRFGPDGEFLGYVGSVIDIDERRGAEDRQRESEARLRTLTNTLPAFVWFATPDGALHYFNDRWYEYTGQTREVALPDGWAATLHPDDVGPTTRIWAEARERGTTYEIEVRYRRHDGAYRWYVARAEPVRGPGGAIDAWFGTSTDIHDRRNAETALKTLNETLESRVAERTRALADSERRFRAIFDTTYQLMGLATLDGTILVVNRAALDAAGVTQDAVAGVRMWEAPWWAPTPHEAARVREGVARVAKGEFVRYESELVLPAGTRVFDFSMKPVLGDAGKPILLVAEGRDITDQKLAEAALRQAQKMDAVGQLTGGIAHDFNNLLGAVMGSFDLIRRKADDVARVRRYAEAGMEAAERGAKLTGQLLAFSRAQRIELRPVVAADIVAGMRDLLGSTLGPAVELGFELDRAGMPVLCDPVQLEMAVLNLAINARDAMGPGGRLTIGTAVRRIGRDPELTPGDYIEISVADTGTGMPPDIAARAFDPFFTTKGPGKGTGLGLSQVYGIARQAGGTARIESRPGEGTTVRLLLPRTEARVPSHGEAVSGPTLPDFRAAAVLVIDDDPHVRRVTVALLEMLGYRAEEAADGPSGLRALEAGLPDVVILDFAMPGMNGAEVARIARERWPALPLVFASGHADTAAIENVAGEGAPILRKPFRIEELQSVLVSVLSQDAS